ncbi:MAG: hypothetical protein PHW22_01175 [Bacilli bacterium]|nr:hypothetical protein [Bacilli bacterium]
MSKDNEKKSPSDKSVRSVYLNVLFLSVIFTYILSTIGWIFCLPVLNKIGNEIQFLAFTLGSGYAYLESGDRLSRSNLLFYISGIFTFYSFSYLFFKRSSPFDSLYDHGILTAIICLFSIRYIIFQICSKISLKKISLKKWKGKENNIEEESNVLRTVHTSLSSYFLFGLIYYFVLCFSSFDFLKISLFIIILVSAFYDIVKIMYLSPTIEYVGIDKSKNTNTNIFSEIINADLFAWTIVIIMFYLYYYDFFNISDCQTLYYFYSSIAQMFAAIVGIVAAFSIFILQKYEGETEVKRSKLKNGITGFLIIYVFIIILSVIGILISNDTSPINMSLLQNDTNIAITKDLINPIIFEFTLLMFPIALLYLYAMIVTFLKLDDISESVYERY